MLTDTTELRKLILENPDLPLLVVTGEDCDKGDFYYTLASSTKAAKGKVLDCRTELSQPDEEYIYTDDSTLEDDLINNLANEKEYKDLTDEEFDKVIKDKMAEYEPYWKECIIIYVD